MFNKPDLKKMKEQNLDILDKMINELKYTRAAVEYDKEAKPYFYLINCVEDKQLKTHSLGNMDMFTIVGMLQSFIISAFTQKKK